MSSARVFCILPSHIFFVFNQAHFLRNVIVNLEKSSLFPSSFWGDQAGHPLRGSGYILPRDRSPSSGPVTHQLIHACPAPLRGQLLHNFFLSICKKAVFLHGVGNTVLWLKNAKSLWLVKRQLFPQGMECCLFTLRYRNSQNSIAHLCRGEPHTDRLQFFSSSLPRKIKKRAAFPTQSFGSIAHPWFIIATSKFNSIFLLSWILLDSSDWDYKTSHVCVFSENIN